MSTDSRSSSQPPLVLRQLQIRRLKSLHEVGPIPIQRGLTVLTGENDGGKTATLDALDFLLSDYRPQAGDRSKWAGEGEELEVEGVFYELSDINERKPTRVKARLDAGGTVTKEILDVVHHDFRARPSDLPMTELRSRMTALGIPLPGGSVKQPHVEAAERWLTERPREEFGEQWRRASAEELERLPNFTRFASAEATSPQTDIQAVVTREARRLLKVDKYAGRLADIGRELDEDIAPSLAHLKAKIEQYCPDLEGVQITASFDFASPTAKVEVQVRRQGQRFDLEASGEGRRRRVALAIYEANLTSLSEETPTATELIAYDEPDTHLDYASQRALFSILDRQAQLAHVQVIVATHSLNFIDRVPLQVIVHFRLKALRTEIEVLSSSAHVDEVRFLESIGAGLGLRNSVVLDERCFLVVEGETEEAATPDLFRVVVGQSMVATGVTPFQTKGSRALRRLVGVLVEDWKRTVMIMSDNDQRDEVVKWASALGLKEGDQVYYMGAREFEDAFSDEVWLKVLETHFPPKDGGDPWALPEIQALRTTGEKYSDALRALVCRRCRDNSIGKPDLGAALGRSVTKAEEVPEALRTCFVAIQQAASHGIGSRPV